MLKEKEIVESLIKSMNLKEKIDIIFDSSTEIPIFPKKITEEKLIKINKWILRYCCWCRTKKISSIRISTKQIKDFASVMWAFNNLRSYSLLRKCVLLYLNFILRSNNAYISSEHKNNRGFFFLYYA